MQTEQLIKAFSATVQASLYSLQMLQPLLEREQVLIGGQDPEALNAIVRQKLALLQQLEPSLQARDRLQVAAGFSSGIEGGNALVDELGHPDLAREWAALITAAASITALNDQNGQLVLHNQRTARTALGLLTGRAESSDTYSRLRRKAGNTPHYSLGKV